MASTALVQAADTMPWTGDKAIGKNQPHVVGQRIYDLKYWEQDSEDDAELLRAKVPLQDRIENFAATQANPAINSKAEIFNMQGDYGNSFFEATTYNNAFAPYLFNYWQYTDYYASWHGITTKGTPENLYDPEASWTTRAFEFGLINMPNPAYTNAAHKNGSKSIGCIFLPRTGQTHSSMIEKDENGEFPVAKKLIEFANFYGFDGYFINQEETIPSADVPVYKEFTKYLIENDIYIQWYDSITPSGRLTYQNRLNASNSTFIHDDAYGLGKVNSSLFVNYDWFRSNYLQTSFDHAAQRNIDLFTEVFFGVEANQGKLSGSHGSALNVDKIYEPGTKNLRGSLALFTPSDWIQRGLEGDIGVKGAENNSGYYWMIAERERMYYSGVAQDPTNTGKMSGYQNSDIGVNNAGGWVGVADFASERSVIGGANFYTNFNTGHGMEYYQNGQVINSNEWANMNIQDILPTWQWWMETDGTKLNVDFDYGQKYQRLNKAGQDIGTSYQKVGGYQGGSSLVVDGTLSAENFLRLYKTDLSVNENSKISVTYNKVSADDVSSMEIGILFKNAPDQVYTINVPNSGKQTNGWVTKTVSIDPEYIGEEIAAIGINFKNNRKTIENYQMNIGELKVTDGSIAKPAAPTNFKIDKAYDTNEMVVSWDIADYNEVKQYNLYANLSDGSRVYLGGAYDSTYYIKSLYGEDDIVSLELKAVGADGTESDAATVSYQYSDKVSNIKVVEATVPTGNKLQNANAGYMDVSWENPAAEYEAIELTVTPAAYHQYQKRDLQYVATVAKDSTSARFMIPVCDGSEYNLAIRLVYADGTKGEAIQYTGSFKDVYSDVYDMNVSVSGKSATFEVPKSEDWWRMYVTVGNTVLQFPDGRNNRTAYAIRGKSSLSNISLPSERGIMEIVLEDYSGNLSDPVYIPYGLTDSDVVDEAMFPDPALLQAVKEQIGETLAEVMTYDGALDLSGTAVKDLTGLNQIGNLSSLDLSNCKELEKIPSGIFSGMNNLKEINITGCNNLQVLKINGTSAEKLIFGDAADFSKLMIVDISDNRFDMTAGTPERNFVDAIQDQIDNYDGPAITEPVSGNVAPNGSITEDTVDDWSANFVSPGNVIDGDRVTEASSGGAIGSYITVDLGSVLPINKWAVYLGGVNGSNCYPSKFTILYSNDNVTFTELETINQKVASVERALSTPIEARYWKFRLDGRATWSSILTEFELYADAEVEIEPSVKFDNQRPLVYPNIESIIRLEKNNNGQPWDAYEYYENAVSNAVTVRGTSLANLKDADFVKPNYNWDDAVVIEEIDLITVTDSNGNVSMEPIDTTKDGVYTVEYISYRDAAVGGRVVYTQTVYVRGITAVLEAVIEKAEQLLADGALENTMEAVVTEFNAALEAAKEIVAGDGASQDEINAATVRLLNVMAKVDWKQGDKTVLQVAVDVANAIKVDIDLYVEEGKQEFLDALARGEELLASGNAWDDEIQAATDALIEAMSNLRMAANKDILNDMINKANSVDFSAYTVESANAVRAALNAAEALAADANATQDAVDAAANTLKAALNGLVVVNGNNPADDANNNGNDNAGTTAPVGDGSAPTQTGDAGSLALVGLIALAGAAAVLTRKKRN